MGGHSHFKFSVHPSILIKLCCLLPFSKYQSLSLAALEVKYAWYLHSLTIHLLICLFLVISLELLITRPPYNSNIWISLGSGYRESTVIFMDLARGHLLSGPLRNLRICLFVFLCYRLNTIARDNLCKNLARRHTRLSAAVSKFIHFLHVWVHHMTFQRNILEVLSHSHYYNHTWLGQDAVVQFHIIPQHRVVTKIWSCWVNTTSRRGIKQLGISLRFYFPSIFLWK